MENLDHTSQVVLTAVSMLFMFGLLMLIAYTTYKDAQDEQRRLKNK